MGQYAKINSYKHRLLNVHLSPILITKCNAISLKNDKCLSYKMRKITKPLTISSENFCPKAAVCRFVITAIKLLRKFITAINFKEKTK